jgi:phosphocarrier protein
VKLKANVKVKNSMGLHTRPATEIVKLLQKFKSQVSLKYKKDTVNARSILGILMLAVHQNAKLEIIVEGEDAEATLNGLVQAFAVSFGE